MILHGDFETHSPQDLKDTGVDVYTKDPDADAWCLAWAFDDDEPELWRNGDPIPVDVMLHIQAGGQFAAHNCQFELAVWNNICVPKHRWLRLKPEQCLCTMCEGYAMALPGKLDDMSAALGIEIRKDLQGNRLAIQMSKPRSVSGAPPTILYEWWDSEDRKQRLYDYCKQDVRVEREVFNRVLRLSDDERKLWVVDCAINQRGVHVDRPAIAAALKVVAVEQTRLADELTVLTGGVVTYPSQVTALTTWIKTVLPESERHLIDGLAKQDIVDHLNDQFWADSRVTRALEIRQEYAKTSVAKLAAMETSVSEDSRLKYILQFGAAGSTGRWGGRRIQPQNMPRPKLKHKEIEAILEFLPRVSPAESIRRMELLYGAPMNVVSDILRGVITAKPGHLLFAGDYANIEGRVVAWLAGEDWKLQAFRDFDAGTGPDLYLLAAARIYGKHHTAYTKSSPERQIGKVSELACGYQGGVGAFQTMATTYGVKVPDEEAEFIKSAWREANPHIVSLWWELDRAAYDAVYSPGLVTTAAKGKIQFRMNGSFLFCRLPSGRCLCYPYARLKMATTWWGEEKEQVHYKCVDDRTKQWTETHTYGGKLTENIVQAIARDMLAFSIMAVDVAKWDIVLHVHDEIVVEAPATGAADRQLGMFLSLMAKQPEWSAGLPLAVEGWTGERYRK